MPPLASASIGCRIRTLSTGQSKDCRKAGRFREYVGFSQWSRLFDLGVVGPRLTAVHLLYAAQKFGKIRAEGAGYSVVKSLQSS